VEDQPGRPALVPSRLAVRTLGRPASLGRRRANKTDELKRALGQIVALPSTPALRHEPIRLQVALINPLINLKGCNGEPPEDRLLLFSILFGSVAASRCRKGPVWALSLMPTLFGPTQDTINDARLRDY
jgi:hypothetical protein